MRATGIFRNKSKEEGRQEGRQEGLEEAIRAAKERRPDETFEQAIERLKKLQGESQHS